MIESYLNRLIAAQMEKRRLDASRLDRALTGAVQALAESPFEIGHRVILNAVMSYRPDGALLDLGGGCGLYHVILKNLGMKVRIVDFQFPETLRERFVELGIGMVATDLYNFDAGKEQYDVVSSFECLEHLPHSPKPIIDKIAAALKPGGEFVMSIPNVVRVEQRWRMLCGKTPHEKYEAFYHSGDYFSGHHREMTREEVRLLFRESGLRLEEIFTTDMTVESLKERSPLKRALHDLNYRHLLTDALMPPPLRKHIWARGVKSV